MARRNTPLENPEKFGEEGLIYLGKISAQISIKIDTLQKLLKNFEKLHLKFKDMVQHLYDNKQHQLCEHHVTMWYLTLMFLHDRSQVIQNGRLWSPYLVNCFDESTDEISDKRNDFSWPDMDDCPLNNVSVQGLKYRSDYYKRRMKDYDVNFPAKINRAAGTPACLDEKNRKLLAVDERLKFMAREIEKIGNNVFRAALTPHGKEILEIRLGSSETTIRLSRTRELAPILEKKYSAIVVSINTQEPIDHPSQENSSSSDYFSARELEKEADAAEAAIAMEKMKVINAARTAQDQLEQAQKRDAIVARKREEINQELVRDRDKQRARIMRQAEKQNASSSSGPGTIVASSKKTAKLSTAASKTSSVEKITTKVRASPPEAAPIKERTKDRTATHAGESSVSSHMSSAEDTAGERDEEARDEEARDEEASDDQSFIAAEGRIPMRRNKRGHLEEDSDAEIEEVAGKKKHAKRKREVAEVYRPFMNSALSQYLVASGRAQLDRAAALAAVEAHETGGEAAAALLVNTEASVGDAEDQSNVSEKASDVVLDSLRTIPDLRKNSKGYGGQSIMCNLYDKLNYKEVMSKTSILTPEARAKSVDTAFCEVVVNDVCDTVMRNLHRDTNTAVYWYQSRFVRNLGDDEIAEVERHQWLLFFVEVKAQALVRLMITPQIQERPDQGGQPSAPHIVKLTKKQQDLNGIRQRSVNTAISKLAKKIIYIYETLNETVLQQDLKQFEGCGFVLPSSSTDMSEVFRSIEMDPDNVLKLMMGKEQDPLFADFKEIVMKKKNRDDLVTHAEKLKAKKEADEKERIEKEAQEKERTAMEAQHKERAEKVAQARSQSREASSPSGSTEAEAEQVVTLNVASRRPLIASDNSIASDISGGGCNSTQNATTAEPADDAQATRGSDNFDSSGEPSSASSHESSSSEPVPPSSVGTVPPFVPVNFDRVSLTLKTIFNNTTGKYGGFEIEHNKLKKAKICTPYQYITQLAHIVCVIAAYKNAKGDISLEDFQGIVRDFNGDEIMNKQVFVVRKLFAESAVDVACQLNTPSDGYCMWWMTLQQKIREAQPDMTCEQLREITANLKVDEELADHIQHYLDTVQYLEEESQNMAVIQLTNILARARESPHLVNPLNLWGNSKLCRFIDVRLMLFCFKSARKMIVNDTPCLMAPLSIVNHALGDMYQDGAPQFTINQLLDMFNKPNYAGFMNSHFFSLENPSGVSEVGMMNEAFKNWLQSIVEEVQDMNPSELKLVQNFYSNNAHHRDMVVNLMVDSEDEEDDEEIVVSESEDSDQANKSLNTTSTVMSTASTQPSQRARFRGEVSFRKAAYGNEQREALFQTVQLLQQRIQELEESKGQHSASLNNSFSSPAGAKKSTPTSAPKTRRKTLPVLSSEGDE